MDSYNIKNHLFYDGYDLDNKKLEEIKYISEFIKDINKTIFNSIGEISIIPYFDGKVKLDGGISGIIIGPNFHFTCHTFCFKKTVFIDYYGDDKLKDVLFQKILKTFKTNNYDLGSKDTPGNFGKHIIIESQPISFNEGTKIVNTILEIIKMTSISELLISKTDNDSFDILQPIAESHISLHQHNNILIMDVFSCKDFNTEDVLQIINNIKNIKIVNRGIQYK